MRNSDRLRTLLGIVLEIGNRLNTAGSVSTNKAGAFSLDSLLKLNHTKAFDKKTTVLHYIVLIVRRNDELHSKQGFEPILNFADDIQMVIKAEKVHWDQCLTGLEDVEIQIETARRMALFESDDGKNHHDDIMVRDIGLTLEEELAKLRATAPGRFALDAIRQLSLLYNQVDATMAKFQSLLEYFGQSHEESDIKRPHELFAIFSQFSRDFGKARKEKKL